MGLVVKMRLRRDLLHLDYQAHDNSNTRYSLVPEGLIINSLRWSNSSIRIYLFKVFHQGIGMLILIG